MHFGVAQVKDEAEGRRYQWNAHDLDTLFSAVS
jgi:hypothetical protein